ncbi:hypothetical protein L5515_013550 [Caenorhabditis briggsae]|uniref:Uncharacterized protein n=1 Tax=Caenorhabditis briggsae TaxID=6238 RepID=A0AAE9J761_CAEBR|nr:hypothetical protein L5515_013550 [Caenorhabditis briggsae]
MKFTLIVFLALAMLACLSNAYMDPVQPKKCKTNADCGDGADDQCVGGLCFEVVKTPKNIDTLTAEGTPSARELFLQRSASSPPTALEAPTTSAAQISRNTKLE